MNPIIALLKEHDISDEQIQTVFGQLTEKPNDGNGHHSATGDPTGKASTVNGLIDAKPSIDQRSRG